MEVLTDDSIDFSKYMRDTDAGENVRPASEYLNDVMHALAPVHDNPTHPKLPFRDAWLYFSPGEVTVWGGFNGSGKSMIQGQVMAGFAEHGQKVCIASFEMKPAKTLARIIRQTTGQANPTKEQVQMFLKRTEGNLWLYDQQGTVKTDRMIAVVKHCAEKLKCQHIAIDSLMKCVRGTDDYNGQKDFIDAITACARDLVTHIHLVVHLKKGEKGDADDRMPTRYDIKGASEISDLPDNVILVWRNKKKERDRDGGKTVSETDPDAVLIVDKSRNGEWEGRVKLWYERSSLRFSDNVFVRRGLAAKL